MFPPAFDFADPALQSALEDCCRAAGIRPEARLDARSAARSALAPGLPRWLAVFQQQAREGSDPVRARLLGRWFARFFRRRLGHGLPDALRGLLYRLGEEVPFGVFRGTQTPAESFQGRRAGDAFRPRPGDQLIVRTRSCAGKTVVVLDAATDGTRSGGLWYLASVRGGLRVCFGRVVDAPGRPPLAGTLAIVSCARRALPLPRSAPQPCLCAGSLRALADAPAAAGCVAAGAVATVHADGMRRAVLRAG